MNAYHYHQGGGNFLAVSHLQFGMRRDDQCQGAGDDYGYYGYLRYYGYLECTETTIVMLRKKFWIIHGIMSLRATFLQERKECEEKYCKKVENEES